MDVTFERVGAESDGMIECDHRVLGTKLRSAAMRDGRGVIE
jgi:hypothetical protein